MFDACARNGQCVGSGFWRHRAGLFVGDAKVSWTGLEWFRPSVILGASSVLRPENALDRAFVGVEADLDLAFRIGRHVVARVAGGLFQPGQAAAAILNEQTDRTATGRIYTTEAALSVVY